MRKPIAEYIARPSGWIELPVMLAAPKPGEEAFTCSFLNHDLAVQMLATVEELPLPVIFLSLAPVYTLLPAGHDKKDLVYRIVYNANKLIAEFFKDRQFLMAPDKPERPDIKNFFHLLEKS